MSGAVADVRRAIITQVVTYAFLAIMILAIAWVIWYKVINANGEGSPCSEKNGTIWPMSGCSITAGKCCNGKCTKEECDPTPLGGACTIDMDCAGWAMDGKIACCGEKCVEKPWSGAVCGAKGNGDACSEPDGTAWPFSGCDVSAGMCCKGKCRTIDHADCSASMKGMEGSPCSAANATPWPLSGCDVSAGICCEGKCSKGLRCKKGNKAAMGAIGGVAKVGESVGKGIGDAASSIFEMFTMSGDKKDIRGDDWDAESTRLSKERALADDSLSFVDGNVVVADNVPAVSMDSWESSTATSGIAGDTMLIGSRSTMASRAHRPSDAVLAAATNNAPIGSPARVAFRSRDSITGSARRFRSPTGTEAAAAAWGASRGLAVARRRGEHTGVVSYNPIAAAAPGTPTDGGSENTVSDVGRMAMGSMASGPSF